MPTRILLGPSFEDFTMTSENFRWLHSCRWEPSHCESFLELRSKLSYAIDSSPKMVKSKLNDPPEIASQWLLVDENDEAIAWAELQRFSMLHDSFGIMFWGRNSTRKEAEFEAQHIARLISFSFVVGKFDRIKLIEMHLGRSEITHKLLENAGELRSTFTFAKHFWAPGSRASLVSFETLEIARDEWEESRSADIKNEQLKQISMRVERFEKAQNDLTPKRKRRSLLARLFHPKIDDSLL